MKTTKQIWARPDFDFPAKDFLDHLEALVTMVMDIYGIEASDKGWSSMSRGGTPLQFSSFANSALGSFARECYYSRINPYTIDSLACLLSYFPEGSAAREVLTCSLPLVANHMRPISMIRTGWGEVVDTPDEVILAHWRMTHTVF